MDRNDEVNTGYLWDNALRAGLTVRDYGFFVDTTCYNDVSLTCSTPLAHFPASTVPVPTIVAPPASASLTPYTDQYFRGFDNNFADYYRFMEWEREFNANYAKGGLPSLSLVRFMHDHTGNFGTAIDLVNTPETQQADNDYAVGLLVQKIANSIYKNNTLIFVIEDDAQDGADHVDSHRTIAFVAGAYVKQHTLVHTQYNTLDFLRTIEEVLGLPQMNLNDALAKPMADIFYKTPHKWNFVATPSAYLYGTMLPLPQKPKGLVVPKSTHDAKYWARVTKGMDFSDADRVDFTVYNRILWKGTMGTKPYPAGPAGPDLAPGPPGAPRELSVVSEPKNGAESQGGHGLSNFAIESQPVSNIAASVDGTHECEVKFMNFCLKCGFTLLIAALVLSVCLPGRAYCDPDPSQSQDWTVDGFDYFGQGRLTPMVLETYTAKGHQAGDDGMVASDKLQRTSLRVFYGLTSWANLFLQFNAAKPNGESYEPEGFEGGFHFDFYQGHNWKLGFAWENEWQRAPKYVDNAFDMDFHPLIEYDVPLWETRYLSLLLNPIVEKNLIGAGCMGRQLLRPGPLTLVNGLVGWSGGLWRCRRVQGHGAGARAGRLRHAGFEL